MKQDHFSLKIQEDGFHKGVKFDCIDCSKQFKHKKTLKEHVNSIHKGMRHKCNLCGKEFAQLGKRNRHMMASVVPKRLLAWCLAIWLPFFAGCDQSPSVSALSQIE